MVTFYVGAWEFDSLSKARGKAIEFIEYKVLKDLESHKSVWWKFNILQSAPKGAMYHAHWIGDVVIRATRKGKTRYGELTGVTMSYSWETESGEVVKINRDGTTKRK